MKKAVYPTMNLDLDYIMNKETMVERSGEILAIGGKKYTVKSSDYLKAVEDKIMDKNMDFAVAGYVLELDYFTYANDTKKACKLIIDSSGYVAEKVIWPNKDTNILTIPTGLEKGAIVWFKKNSSFIKKKKYIIILYSSYGGQYWCYGTCSKK